MYAYFEMLKQVADLDKTEYSIRDLSIEIADRAGYYRAPYTFDNGSVRERTWYKRPFDNILTAKWLMFYRSLFINKLRTHPEFEDGAIDIINNTFFITMSCLQIDKLVDDDVINRYVNLALSGRIRNYLIEIGSLKRLEEYKSGQKLNMRLNKSVLSQALSLDELMQQGSYDPMYEDNNDVLLTVLYDKLKNIPYGIELLETLLQSRFKVHMSRINQYMYIDTKDLNERTLSDISMAYHIIKEELKKVIHNRYLYDFSLSNEEEIAFCKEVKTDDNV